MMFRWIYSILRKRKPLSADANNVVVSIGKAKALYRELIVMAHPDRHPDKLELAEEITKLLNENRRNHSELLLLKQRIENEL